MIYVAGMVVSEDQFWGRAALQRAREPKLTGACYLSQLVNSGREPAAQGKG